LITCKNLVDLPALKQLFVEPLIVKHSGRVFKIIERNKCLDDLLL